MKQVKITDKLREKITNAVGPDVDVSKFAVFSATAMNTLPVRKVHPVYKDGVHSRSFLEQMQAALAGESLPLQVMHDSSVLPIGRVFDSELVDLGSHSELRTLFWVDRSTSQGQEYTDLVDNGTIDQVSVSVLPKEAISNKSGFDFLSDEAGFDNIWSGTDPDGNVMGKDGAHVQIHNLEAWFEMSLVGKGGLRGAKIHSGGSLQLSDKAHPLTLNLSFSDKEPKGMDLTELVEKLTTEKAEKLAVQAQLTTATEALTVAQARIAELEAGQVEGQAEKLTAAETQVNVLKGQLDGLFSHVAAIIGDVTAKADDDVEKLVLSIKTNISKLRPTPGSLSLDASTGTGDRTSSQSNSAFKRAR